MKFVYVYETESERTTSIQPWILSDITVGFTDKKTKDSVSVCKQLYKCMKESSESNRRIIYCSREKATKDLRCQGLEIQSLMMQKLKGNSEGKKLFLQDSQENMRAESRE